jgi:hypothetical protein
MWVLSIFALPFLVYGLSTGKVWVGGHGASRTYSREIEPRGFWRTIAFYCFFIIIGVVGTIYPSIDDPFEDVITAVVLLAAVTIFSLLLYSRYRKRDEG